MYYVCIMYLRTYMYVSNAWDADDMMMGKGNDEMRRKRRGRKPGATPALSPSLNPLQLELPLPLLYPELISGV
jgi:hypothetical protein